jgi:hypothetical protein
LIILERASAVVTAVSYVVPEITESVADLPKLLSDVRNDFAHQLPDKKKQALEDRFRSWIVVTYVTLWLIRALLLLLLHAGVEPQVFRDG